MPYDPFGPPPAPRKRIVKKRPQYQYSPGVLGSPVYPTDPGDLGYTPPKPELPNYQAILENDPLYKLRAGQLSAESVADKASLDAAINSALINYGSVPDTFASSNVPGGLNLDPNTRALAEANTKAGLSTVARLLAAHNQRNQLNSDVLGARGMSASGALGSSLGAEQQQYTAAGYDAVQQLNQYAAGLQAGYAEHERQRQDALATSMREAAARQAADEANQQQKLPKQKTVTSITLPAPPPAKKKKKALPGVYNVGGAAYGRGL